MKSTECHKRGDRLYINATDLVDADFYKSGFVKSVYVNGEKISNAEANRSYLVKVYVDAETNELVGTKEINELAMAHYGLEAADEDEADEVDEAEMVADDDEETEATATEENVEAASDDGQEENAEMEIIEQNSKVLLNVVKSYSELTPDELDKLIFPSGESKDDYADYQVRRNGKNEVIGVRPYSFTEERKADIERGRQQSQNWLDALQVQYGHGKDKSQAKKRLGEQGIDARILTPLPPYKNLIDSYLADFDTTRYEVAKKSGIAATTLQNAARKNTAFGLNTKVVGAIAYTIGTEPGKVLNDLMMLEAHRDAGEQNE